MPMLDIEFILFSVLTGTIYRKYFPVKNVCWELIIELLTRKTTELVVMLREHTIAEPIPRLQTTATIEYQWMFDIWSRITRNIHGALKLILEINVISIPISLCVWSWE